MQRMGYSATHNSGEVGLIPVLLGGNSPTGGACVFCYSHSSYFAEIPEKYLANNKKVINPEYINYINVWGTPDNRKNTSEPELVIPNNSGGFYENSPY